MVSAIGKRGTSTSKKRAQSLVSAIETAIGKRGTSTTKERAQSLVRAKGDSKRRGGMEEIISRSKEAERKKRDGIRSMVETVSKGRVSGDVSWAPKRSRMATFVAKVRKK